MTAATFDPLGSSTSAAPCRAAATVDFMPRSRLVALAVAVVDTRRDRQMQNSPDRRASAWPSGMHDADQDGIGLMISAVRR
jgi:hypothetical protein